MFTYVVCIFIRGYNIETGKCGQIPKEKHYRSLRGTSEVTYGVLQSNWKLCAVGFMQISLE